MSLKVWCENNRFILLLGAARSGTTWLANILNSYPGSLYSHEPMLAAPIDVLTQLLTKVRETGQLTLEERELILWHWSRARLRQTRPPFFRKSFSRWPPTLVWAVWLATRALNGGSAAFSSAFSPGANSRYDLLVKQGGVSPWAGNFIGALAPDATVVLLRHPCAVIASALRGQQLKVMPAKGRDQWLMNHVGVLQSYGYHREQVERMTQCEFLALSWLIENTGYLDALAAHGNGRLLIYRDLVKDPTRETRSLFSWLGWEVPRQTERFLAATSAGQPSSLARLFTSGHDFYSIYRGNEDGLGRWRSELSEDEQRQIATIAKPLLERYWPVSDPAMT